MKIIRRPVSHTVLVFDLFVVSVCVLLVYSFIVGPDSSSDDRGMLSSYDEGICKSYQDEGLSSGQSS